jgi:serine/threonine protein phosphatase 1
MTFAIGDVHGEVTKLKELLNNIYSIDSNAKLIFLGDYINKGEDSKATLDLLVTLENVEFLIGNHEYYFLEFFKNGKYKDTLIKYASNSTFIDFDMNINSLEDKLFFPYENFFNNLKPYYINDNYFISHSGISLEYIEQEFDKIPLREFLFNRYDFFNYDKKVHDRISIFGHTGFNYPFYDGIKIGIDTSAVYWKDARLTSFCLEKEFFINNKNEKSLLKDFELNSTPWINRVSPYRLKDLNE